LIGLSHLQQGDPLRALAMLAPPLETAERRDGRRGFAASVLAVVVAAALLELDRLQDAEPLLAHRMDLLDRVAPPDVLLLAHRSVCRIALAQGDERRALRALDRLAALADARDLPRLALHALVERIRAHALQERRGIVDGLLDELDAMAPVFEAPDWRPFQPGYRLQRAVAHAHAAIARRDFVAASTHLDTAAACNAPAHPNRESLNVDVLRAVVAHKRREPDALRRLAEARSLGRLGGCHRLLAEAHPLALALDRQLEPDDATAPPPPRRPRRLALRGGLLTAKEAEVLAMLDRGMTNKAIARALDISHETVKWHVHNLSLKLEANTRRHAVDRARMLGLLGP